MLIYQSLIIFYLTAAAVLLFCRLLHGAAIKWPAFLLWAARILLSLLLYVWIAKSVRGGESSYLMNQIQWRSQPLLTCLKDIAIEYGKILTISHSGHFSLYLPGMILLIILLVGKLRNQGQTKHETILLVLSAAALLLLPMAISIMEGSRPVPRTQFALQVIGAFLPVCFPAETKKACRPLVILLFFAVILQSALVVRLTNTDNRRNEQDLDAANRITADLIDLDTEDKPLVFIGTLPFADDSMDLEKTDIFGLSFFEWSYDPARPGSATPGAIRLLSAVSEKPYASPTSAMRSQAAKLASSMPAYPNEGYLFVTDKYCIIKLSD